MYVKLNQNFNIVSRLERVILSDAIFYTKREEKKKEGLLLSKKYGYYLCVS